jgi:hypothetical protein
MGEFTHMMKQPDPNAPKPGLDGDELDADQQRRVRAMTPEQRATVRKWFEESPHYRGLIEFMDTLETEPKTAREWVKDISDEGGVNYLVMDDYDDCIVGICDRFHDSFVVYDRDKVINKLMERDGMDEEEAVEFFEFNIVGGWHGEQTVGFVTFPKLGGES